MAAPDSRAPIDWPATYNALSTLKDTFSGLEPLVQRVSTLESTLSEVLVQLESLKSLEARVNHREAVASQHHGLIHKMRAQMTRLNEDLEVLANISVKRESEFGDDEEEDADRVKEEREVEMELDYEYVDGGGRGEREHDEDPTVDSPLRSASLDAPAHVTDTLPSSIVPGPLQPEASSSRIPGAFTGPHLDQQFSPSPSTKTTASDRAAMDRLMEDLGMTPSRAGKAQVAAEPLYPLVFGPVGTKRGAPIGLTDTQSTLVNPPSSSSQHALLQSQSEAFPAATLFSQVTIAEPASASETDTAPHSSFVSTTRTKRARKQSVEAHSQDDTITLSLHTESRATKVVRRHAPASEAEDRPEIIDLTDDVDVEMSSPSSRYTTATDRSLPSIHASLPIATRPHPLPTPRPQSHGPSHNIGIDAPPKSPTRAKFRPSTPSRHAENKITRPTTSTHSNLTTHAHARTPSHSSASTSTTATSILMAGVPGAFPKPVLPESMAGRIVRAAPISGSGVGPAGSSTPGPGRIGEKELNAAGWTIKRFGVGVGVGVGGSNSPSPSPGVPTPTPKRKVTPPDSNPIDTLTPVDTPPLVRASQPTPSASRSVIDQQHRPATQPDLGPLTPSQIRLIEAFGAEREEMVGGDTVRFMDLALRLGMMDVADLDGMSRDIRALIARRTVERVRSGEDNSDEDDWLLRLVE